MSDGIDGEIIKKTQEILGKYVKKPALTEKLLSKPPFRFLHDIVNAVIKNTGFLKGIFSPDELNPDFVKDRDSKLAFLNKLIDTVKSITNIDLKVRASKIVAGVQVNETNLLLQAIAYGINHKLDSSEYLKKLKDVQNDVKSEQTKGKNKSNKETKTGRSARNEKKHVEEKNRDNKSRSKLRDSSRDSKLISKENISKEKKPKGKPETSSSRTSNSDRKPEKIERSKLDSVDSPQSITKSSKNEKFIVQESNEISDTHQTNEKVVSGKTDESEIVELEANVEDRPRTRDIENGYLAKITKDNNIDTTDVLTQGSEVEKNSDVLIVESEKVINTPAIRQTSARPKSARPKSGELRNISGRSNTEDETEKNKKSVPADNIVLQTNVNQRPRSSLRPPSVRPSSARPGAPRLRPDSALPVQEVIPMGKINVIVENYDNDADEEETVIIHNAPEEILTIESKTELPAKNQSHLVEQILDQINESGDLSKTEADLNWEHENLQGRDITSKQMNHLRNLVQNFSKTANPLGKLLNYLHEDMESMHAELQQWTQIKSQLFAEMKKREKMRTDMDKPLFEKLENLNAEITKLEKEILDIRGNIIKNDKKIKELISK